MYFLSLLSFRDESFFLSSAEMAALWTATPAGPSEPDAGAGALALALALFGLLTGGFLLRGFLPVLRDWDGPPQKELEETSGRVYTQGPKSILGPCPPLRLGHSGMPDPPAHLLHHLCRVQPWLL